MSIFSLYNWMNDHDDRYLLHHLGIDYKTCNVPSDVLRVAQESLTLTGKSPAGLSRYVEALTYYGSHPNPALPIHHPVNRVQVFNAASPVELIYALVIAGIISSFHVYGKSMYNKSIHDFLKVPGQLERQIRAYPNESVKAPLVAVNPDLNFPVSEFYTSVRPNRQTSPIWRWEQPDRANNLFWIRERFRTTLLSGINAYFGEMRYPAIAHGAAYLAYQILQHQYGLLNFLPHESAVRSFIAEVEACLTSPTFQIVEALVGVGRQVMTNLLMGQWAYPALVVMAVAGFVEHTHQHMFGPLTRGLEGAVTRRTMVDVRDPLVTALAHIMQGCSALFMSGNIAIAIDHPAEVHIDSQMRPHNETGPAIRYSDGVAIHALCGEFIPEQFITNLHRIEPREILHSPNAEVRRILMQRYGVQKLLKDAHCVPLHTDECGTLYHIKDTRGGQSSISIRDWNFDAPMFITTERVIEALVLVKNSTPEPDGTYKDYVLFVPPNITTARAGVAWTFGLTAEQYQPLQES